MAYKLIPQWVLILREDLMNLWDEWEIQALVIGSLSFQVILTLFGSHQVHVTGPIGLSIRSVLRGIYLVVNIIVISFCTFVPYSLGKLTGLRIDDPSHPDPGVELKALLAPLLMLQLGYPSNLTAYSIEDNRLGLRQVLKRSIIVMVIVSILIRCWNYTDFAILYFPMFLASIIKYAEKIARKKTVSLFLDDLPKIDVLGLVVKAYYHFHCLKPHLEDWIYHPSYISTDQLSIDKCLHQEAFRITEIELALMYDMLYTKAPVIYTKLGLFVWFASFFWLGITLGAFSALEKSVNPLAEITYSCMFVDTYQYKGFTFCVLMLAFLLEAYQSLLLPYFEWGIAKMSKHYNWPLVPTFLRIIAPSSLYQFNLLCYCLRRDWTRYIKFLNFWGTYEYIKWNWALYRMGPVSLSKKLKKSVLEELKWSFTRYNASNKIRQSIETAFDKSIVVWHIATDICYHHLSDEKESSEQRRHLNNDESPDSQSRSKLISDYMMYLLVIRPKMLSTITGSIVFRHACRRVKEIRRSPVTMESQLADSIFNHEQSSMSSGQGQDHNTLVTLGWDVISDAQGHVRNLLARPDRWKLVNSMWMEMLCYAGVTVGRLTTPSRTVRLSRHTDQLRRGGELITLIWLIFTLKTDKPLAP
ncbi:hypothetical protein ACJRO7_013402 [Eucalyptus globulus]|uniref:DUF4220 domain-containing protein n=1 Tax=Eucalyptus globulus TaxID=34317 RepID=A0ABD3KXI6_EUCGL